MKTLVFYHRGNKFTVNEKGYINNSSTWIFKGVSFHHWRTGLDMNLEDCFNNPKGMCQGLVWDTDHGNTRQWGGSYCGSIPRVSSAYIQEG